MATSKNLQPNSLWQLFLIFLKLGLSSFGGPVAHIAYFRDEFVTRRQWLTERSYADLVALCQFLPGPASSQVGLAVGLSRGGYQGALAAWLGFTFPSALALILFAMSLSSLDSSAMVGVIHGLKIVAVAVVAQAVWAMAKNLCPDRARLTIMAITSSIVLLIPSPLIQLLIIIVAGLVGVVLFRVNDTGSPESLAINISFRAGKIALSLFFILLIGLPLLVQLFPNQSQLVVIDIFYRAGALVFGGGHVVLPLLQSEVVPAALIGNDTFLAGYGAAQAVPGPLFTFAAFIGASLESMPVWQGALLSLIAIFLPSFLLVIGVLPFWHKVQNNNKMRSALLAINAAVVGLLLAALYNPVWTSTIQQSEDFVLGLIAFSMLMFWRCPPWLVVILCGTAGWVLTLV